MATRTPAPENRIGDKRPLWEIRQFARCQVLARILLFTSGVIGQINKRLNQTAWGDWAQIFPMQSSENKMSFFCWLNNFKQPNPNYWVIQIGFSGRLRRGEDERSKSLFTGRLAKELAICLQKPRHPLLNNGVASEACKCAGTCNLWQGIKGLRHKRSRVHWLRLDAEGCMIWFQGAANLWQVVAPRVICPTSVSLQQEPFIVNDGWRTRAFVCISCALVKRMRKGCLKGITKINCLTVRFAGHSWWRQNRREWSMLSSHCSRYQWHSVCHIPFFESLSIPDPNGRAAITWFSFDKLFLTFFWQSQWHSECHMACVESLVQRLLHRPLLTIFFMTISFWKNPMAQRVPYRFVERLWISNFVVTTARWHMWGRNKDSGDHMTTRWRRHDDDTVATWRRHGHDMSNCRQSIATLPARQHIIDSTPMSSSRP